MDSFRRMQIAPVRKFRTWPGSRICALAGTDGQCLQKRLISPGYGHSFLPWLEPVAISAGQEIQAELHADLVGGDHIWRWETKICGVDHHFQQSTHARRHAIFAAVATTRHAMDFVPCSPKQGRRSAAGRAVSARLGVGRKALPLTGAAADGDGKSSSLCWLLATKSPDRRHIDLR